MSEGNQGEGQDTRSTLRAMCMPISLDLLHIASILYRVYPLSMWM
jgi:hypothetical protein